jgi:hypothetical protein
MGPVDGERKGRESNAVADKHHNRITSMNVRVGSATFSAFKGSERAVCSVPALLGNTTQSLLDFVYRAITFYGALFQSTSTIKQICNSVSGLLLRLVGPSTPKWQRQQALTPFCGAGARAHACPFPPQATA